MGGQSRFYRRAKILVPLESIFQADYNGISSTALTITQQKGNKKM